MQDTPKFHTQPPLKTLEDRFINIENFLDYLQNELLVNKLATFEVSMNKRPTKCYIGYEESEDSFRLGFYWERKVGYNDVEEIKRRSRFLETEDIICSEEYLIDFLESYHLLEYFGCKRKDKFFDELQRYKVLAKTKETYIEDQNEKRQGKGG